MLAQLSRFRRSFLDVREGEYGRTLFVSLYLMFVLFAYYILKPVSRALFVDRMDPDKLPGLYMLIAPVGGLLAYVYSRVTMQISLKAAVNAATFFSIGFTVLMGYLIKFQWVWTYYVFNIWVSMFSIMMVTQGWVLAANVFNTREAKRLYGMLGLGSVIGAGFGGSFTAFAVTLIGENNLIYFSALITLLAYLMFIGLLRVPGVNLEKAKAHEDEPEETFSFGDIMRDIRHYRHLQVIVGIVLLTFIVDVTVEYQFQVFAKSQYKGRELTAFMGSFNGIYLNLVNFVFQFFLTAAVVRWVGVGGVLQIMPITISMTSLGIFFAPGVLSTSLARLTEAATRYTFNRTGMELLYLPLPLDLRNRTKAFLDIFVDRFGRGFGGLFLQIFTVWLAVKPRELSLVILLFTASWSVLAWMAQREYLRSVRRRLESRTLDFEEIRISVSDPAVIALLETTARGDNARQAAYALRLLGETQGYDAMPLATSLAGSRLPDVRARVFSLAAQAADESLLPQALAEIRNARAGATTASIKPAVDYALSVSPERQDLASRLLNHPSGIVAEAALALQPADSITLEWVTSMASSPDGSKRRLAAIALRKLGDTGTPLLHSLLADGQMNVAEAALATAGELRKRIYLEHIVQRLADSQLRGAALDALANYGSTIAGTLRDLLEDPQLAASIRRRIPRALEHMRDQRAADELMAALSVPDLTLRAAVVEALSRLRRAAPELNFGPSVVDREILDEAKRYYVLSASIDPFRQQAPASGATRLLASTLEERLNATLLRLFQLLGLRYPAAEIHAAHRALKGRSSEDHSAAIEFLDSVVDREVKRYLMPLLDDHARVLERAKDLYGIERHTLESALRELIKSGDPWLVCCAIAAGAKLKMSSLKADVLALEGKAGLEVDRLVAAWPN
jgi:ATP/ADP translocase